MRLANLAALHLETNVIRIGGPEPTYHLVIPPEDVKNDQPLEYPLPKAVSEMLERYLSVFRPRLCRHDNPWLFPGEGVGHKTKGTLSGQIIERDTQGARHPRHAASIPPPRRGLYPGERPGQLRIRPPGSRAQEFGDDDQILRGARDRGRRAQVLCHGT